MPLSQEGRTPHDYSARRIIGFGCNQAFAFFLFYLQASYLFDVGATAGVPFLRPELLAFLVSLVAGFATLTLVQAERRQRLFARPLLYMYALIMGIAALAPTLLAQLDPGIGRLVSGMLAGFPCGILLTAWGQTFGQRHTGTSITEVFLGSLVAALLSLAFSAAAAYSDAVWIAMCLLPLANVANIEVPEEERRAAAPAAQTKSARATDEAAGSSEIGSLSAKILAGTFLFGVAAGCLDIGWFLPGAPDVAADGAAASLLNRLMLSLVLFGSFLIGALTLQSSDGFGRGTALNKSYRVAIFVFVAGAMIAPWPFEGIGAFAGEGMMLAGYLGLEAVLVSLFLVIAGLSGTQAAVAFSQGFLSLFAGETAGVLLANLTAAIAGSQVSTFLVILFAGVLVLLSYIFLFTERDFDKLSQMENVSDMLEQTCAAIVARYGLSAREADVLAYCLRGRTGERIAQELFISKSTVETHLKRIYGKTGVHNRQELLDLGESIRTSLASNA